MEILKDLDAECLQHLLNIIFVGKSVLAFIIILNYPVFPFFESNLAMLRVYSWLCSVSTPCCAL